MKDEQQNSTMSSVITDEEFKTFIGKNADKYLVQFKKFNVGGVDRFKVTWHWPAFFVPLFWLLYRKLYLWCVLLIFIVSYFLPSPYFIFFLAMIAFGITGNYIYYKHTKKKLLKLKKLPPSSDIQKTGETARAFGIRYTNIATVLVLMLLVPPVIYIVANIHMSWMYENARKGAVTRAASAAEPELQAWLNSSLKKGKDAALREIDTNGDDKVDTNDMTNAELSVAGVCKTYAAAHKAMKWDSPWPGMGELFTTGAGKGQISCIQSGNNITITARDKEGYVLYTKTITPQL